MISPLLRWAAVENSDSCGLFLLGKKPLMNELGGFLSIWHRFTSQKCAVSCFPEQQESKTQVTVSLHRIARLCSQQFTLKALFFLLARFLPLVPCSSLYLPCIPTPDLLFFQSFHSLIPLPFIFYYEQFKILSVPPFPFSLTAASSFVHICQCHQDSAKLYLWPTGLRSGYTNWLQQKYWQQIYPG